ncbi:MAG: efflux RND transporter periplasmic adaptor subunit [Nitrospira sp.]|nr:efflux RND transporter periplasmic adaptor subunit [Nitrospira sp.]
MAVGACLALLYWFVPVPSSSLLEVDTASIRTVGGYLPGSLLTASGYVVAQRQAYVASKGTGRLEYLGVTVGSQVKAGEIIARVQQDDIQAVQRQARARLDVAKATLANVQAELQDARQNYDRANALLPNQFISQSEFDLATNRLRRSEAAVRSATAAIRVAEADVEAADVMLKNTVIRAPFDGTVLKKFAEIGEIVAPMGSAANARSAVVLIADMTSLAVEADISESAIAQVSPGQSADITLDAAPATRYAGMVEQIVPTADRSKGTVLAKIRFIDRDDRVLPEMSAKVFFAPPGQANASTQPRFVVPSSSLARRHNRTVVYVLEDEIAREVPVEEVGKNGGDSHVVGSLTASATIVLSPPPSLTDGSRARARSGR